MSTMRTARERARAEVRAEILTTARHHLAEHGPTDLSLRAVARDLGVVPSAVYRYFDGRDALLTALISEAYTSLGDAVDVAVRDAARRRPRARWLAAAHAVRAWGRANTHEYALLYGTPVPGYAAPQETVTPGTRVPLALLHLLADAHAAGELDAVDSTISTTIRRDLVELAREVGVDLPPEAVLRGLIAWTQLFGLVSFELFHQTRGMVSDDEALFDDAVQTMARTLGLR